jgi:hypothetical protein
MRLLTDEELEALTWPFPAEWPEYERIEEAHKALCVEGPMRRLD